MMTFMDRCINHGLAGKAADLSIITFILDLVSISIRGVLASAYTLHSGQPGTCAHHRHRLGCCSVGAGSSDVADV